MICCRKLRTIDGVLLSSAQVCGATYGGRNNVSSSMHASRYYAASVERVAIIHVAIRLHPLTHLTTDRTAARDICRTTATFSGRRIYECRRKQRRRHYDGCDNGGVCGPGAGRTQFIFASASVPPLHSNTRTVRVMRLC
jgi:hypothetical protein